MNQLIHAPLYDRGFGVLPLLEQGLQIGNLFFEIVQLFLLLRSVRFELLIEKIGQFLADFLLALFFLFFDNLLGELRSLCLRLPLMINVVWAIVTDYVWCRRLHGRRGYVYHRVLVGSWLLRKNRRGRDRSGEK